MAEEEVKKKENKESANDFFRVEDFALAKPHKIKDDLLRWLAQRQGEKRFSKDPDVIVINKEGVYDYDKSKEMHDLIDKYELTSNLFTKTEQHLSYNNGKTENAHAVWTIDVINDKPIIKLETNIQSITEVAGEVESVTIIKEIIKSTEGKTYSVVEIRNKDGIERRLVDKDLKEIDNDNIPKDVKDQILEELYKKQEWKYNGYPFEYIKNNSDALSDSAFIDNELKDYVILSQKKKDDIFLSSVKVVEVGPISSRKKAVNGNKENTTEAMALANRIAYSSTSIVISDNVGLEGTAKASIVNGIPNTQWYDNAIRTVINTILKKTGGATDVDSKGTVQQSKSEVLMSQGDEFKVAKWKLNNRQKKLRRLFSTIGEIIGVKEGNVFVIISQEEVLAETELIDNLIKAKNAGFMTDLMAYARYNQVTLVEAFTLSKIQFIKESK